MKLPGKIPDYDYPQSALSYQAGQNSTNAAYGVLFLISIYYLVPYFNSGKLPISELLWNILARITPAQILSRLDREFETVTMEDNEGIDTDFDLRSHASRSNAMHRNLGSDGVGISSTVQRRRLVCKIGDGFRPRSNSSVPGLGNWDNSCYQNCVLQGLASLSTLSTFLEGTKQSDSVQPTRSALRALMGSLNDPANRGETIWTPSKLKNMSSWQQQDAQEYFSKLFDELEKDLTNDSKRKSGSSGLRSLLNKHQELLHPCSRDRRQDSEGRIFDTEIKTSGMRHLPEEVADLITRSPLEGLLAQRVGCQRCGFVEGLSMVPFNCLTVPLGRQWFYDVRSCLDEYTALEPITEVECAKCSLLHAKTSIDQVLHLHSIHRQSSPKDSLIDDSIPSALRLSLLERLELVERALEEEDFSDQALKKCLVPPKSRVLTTKSRQAVIARAPRSLVIHVNRSNFDEASGKQIKNQAIVGFPKQLNLDPWCLGSATEKDEKDTGTEKWNTNPSESMLSDSSPESSQLSNVYQLKAVITHYGRHENGHYICYRKSRAFTSFDVSTTNEIPESWWRLSDEDVSEVGEDFVLSQGGVFMLFYERPNYTVPPQRQPLASLQSVVNTEDKTSKEPPNERTPVSPEIRPASNQEDALPTPPLTPMCNPSRYEPCDSSESPKSDLETTTANTAIVKPLELLGLPRPANSPDVAKRMTPVEKITSKIQEVPIEPSPDAPSEILPKDTRPVSPLSMRTAGPPHRRGSVSLAGTAMGSMAGFVQAN